MADCGATDFVLTAGWRGVTASWPSSDDGASMMDKLYVLRRAGRGLFEGLPANTFGCPGACSVVSPSFSNRQ